VKQPKLQIQSLTSYTGYLILIKIKCPPIRIRCMYINKIIRSEFLLDLPYENKLARKVCGLCCFLLYFKNLVKFRMDNQLISGHQGIGQIKIQVVGSSQWIRH
jgi:hypothetical protein